MTPYYQDEWVTLYHGDCREVLPSLLSVDLVLTDPPYGISLSSGNSINRERVIVGDNEPFDPAFLLSYSSVVLWGGNNFADRLPAGGWLCWDKRCTSAADKIIGSPFELAWCNDQSKFKMYRVQHGGVINADGPNTKRYHPTQKPVRLFRLVLWDFSGDSSVTVDPFMGSGTTLRAAKDLGRKAIGIEIEEKYCEIAARRCELVQPSFFDTPVERDTQDGMFQ